MLKIKNLTKKYGDKLILNKINLDIEPGTFTTLLGENGVGKSTLLRMMSGFELPDSGEVTYKDKKLTDLKFPYVHDLFFVHEDINYVVPFNMDKFISLLSQKIPRWDQQFFEEMVLDRKMNLKQNFQDFSRGQKMQIVLMMAMASNAPVLLLDEITSVIDVYGRKYFLDLLDKYVKKGNTVVMTTNVISELEFYTQKIVILKDRAIVLNEDTKNIPRNFVKVRKAPEGEHPIFTDPSCVWANVNSDRSISYVVPHEVASNYDLPTDIIDNRQTNLEDLFIYYFTKTV